MRVIVAGRLSKLDTDRDQTGLSSQERESVRWAESQGHEVVAVVADFKSGKSHLWDRPHLRPWVTEPDLLARYDAVVALKVDRLTRADDAGVDAMKAWARKHGKMLLISTAEVHFPSEGTDGMMWDLMIRTAHAEWLATSERYKRMLRTKRENGEAIGRCPWGYTIAGKRLVPTSEGRKYIPQIFDRVIRGEGTRAIAAWLTSEGVKTRQGNRVWNESFIPKLVGNSVCYGKRYNSGNLEVEALISLTTFQAAQLAMKSRVRLGRGASENHVKPLLSPYCGACIGVSRPGCEDGLSRLYRVFVGAPDRRRAYYHCRGSGPGRKGCGARMIPCEMLDETVTEAMLSDGANHWTHDFVAGDDRSDEIAKLRMRAASAEDSEDYDTADTLRREARELSAMPKIAPHYDDIETDRPEGDYFRELTIDQRRDYLAQHLIVAHKTADADMPPVVSISKR